MTQEAVTLDIETLRHAIQQEYADVATNPDQGFHFHTGRKLAALLGYRPEWLERIPEGAIESLAGTGNPFSLGEIYPGEHVVDIGSGAGIDSLIAATMVEPEGRVIGVDMTPAMLEMARGLAAERGSANVTFVEGDAELLPWDDRTFDVVTCRVCAHHFPHVARAVREMARVLRPGGRFILMEHVRSPLRGVRAGQHLLEPLFLRFEHDHLTRDPLDYLQEEGFEVESATRLKWGIVERTVARKPRENG